MNIARFKIKFKFTLSAWKTDENIFLVTFSHFFRHQFAFRTDNDIVDSWVLFIGDNENFIKKTHLTLFKRAIQMNRKWNYENKKVNDGVAMKLRPP